MKSTELKMSKEFWAIVRYGDAQGYHTGVASMRTTLIETDTATELDTIIANGTVGAGESMGDYVFDVIALSHTWDIFNQIVNYEKVEK